MSDITIDTMTRPQESGHNSPKPVLDMQTGLMSVLIFLGILACGLLFTAYSIYEDITVSGVPTQSILPFLLLGVALLIALGFEFVNGFHDTANAVATVIYTHSLPPTVAVIWSGFFNFVGVATSAGAVAYGIISLLPVELIIQVGSDAGFAMVFALLIAAIVWNLGTWWLGLPASSSHTMIGSIIGVGIANALMHGRDGTSGVDWSKATEIGQALLLSPIFGFCIAASLFFALKAIIRIPALYTEPKGKEPPPWWIRAILIFTCTGVSFFHGSNDGQKGMGLIMLILIGTVPTAYALNRAMPENQVAGYVATTKDTVTALTPFVKVTKPASVDAQRSELTEFVRTRQLTDTTLATFASFITQLSGQVAGYGDYKKMPTQLVQNVRNDMYVSSESIKFLLKSGDLKLDDTAKKKLGELQSAFNTSTKFIPLWVKIAVAIALGLGTMVGWKRIVVTVGEKIGKQHLTYAQGASAEIVAMATIGAADGLGLPVSTTHVLSSGIAGTMAANGSGLQWATLRNIALAWVLTLPAAMLLSATLFIVFRAIV